MAERRTAWFAVRARKHGPTRAGVEELVAEQVGLDPVLVELARSTADLTDSAKRAQDPRLWLSASGRLTVILARLGVGRSDGDVAASGGADDVPDLADVVGGAPEVRDPAEP